MPLGCVVVLVKVNAGIPAIVVLATVSLDPLRFNTPTTLLRYSLRVMLKIDSFNAPTLMLALPVRGEKVAIDPLVPSETFHSAG